MPIKTKKRLTKKKNTFKTRYKKGGTDEDDVCSICLEILTSDDIRNINRDVNIPKFSGCKHTFHKNCIERWLNASRIDPDGQPRLGTCPVCRAEETPQRPQRDNRLRNTAILFLGAVAAEILRLEVQHRLGSRGLTRSSMGGSRRRTRKKSHNRKTK
tara:strand:- start:5241 stop:5711 length:471 start_codon:yes stop_codon:yes gene_type:complete